MQSLKIKPPQVSSIPMRDNFPSASFSSKSIPQLKDMKDGESAILKVRFKKRGSNSDNNHTMVHGDLTHGEYHSSDEDSPEQ